MTMTINLGKLKRIDNLRAIWEYEQTDFSKWLSKEENLELQFPLLENSY